MAHILKHHNLTEQIIGIFFAVYNELGHGFLESVHHQSMLVALTESGLAVESQIPIQVYFRGCQVGVFRADLLVEDSVLIELKAGAALEKAQESQLLNYLRATDIEVGLLLSFGERAQFKRLVFENTRKKFRENPLKSASSAAGF